MVRGLFAPVHRRGFKTSFARWGVRDVRRTTAMREPYGGFINNTPGMSRGFTKAVIDLLGGAAPGNPARAQLSCVMAQHVGGNIAAGDQQWP